MSQATATTTTTTLPLLLAVPLGLLNGLCIALLATTILTGTWYLSMLLAFTNEACLARAASDVEAQHQHRNARSQRPAASLSPRCRCSCCDLVVILSSKVRWSDDVETMLAAATALGLGSWMVWYAGMKGAAEMVCGEWGRLVAMAGLVVGYAPVLYVPRASCRERVRWSVWKYLRRVILEGSVMDEEMVVGVREEAAPTQWRHLLSNDSEEELDDEADYWVRVLEPLPGGRDSVYSDALEWQDVDSDDEDSEDDDNDDDESGDEDSEDDVSEEWESDDETSGNEDSDDEGSDDVQSETDDSEDEESSDDDDDDSDEEEDDGSDSEWEDVEAVWEQWRSNQETILKGLHMIGTLHTQDPYRLDRGMILRGLDVLGSVAEEDEADGRLDRALMLRGLEALGLESSR